MQSVGGSRRGNAGSSASSSGTKAMRQLTLSGAFFSRCSKAGVKEAPGCTPGEPSVVGSGAGGVQCAVEGEPSGVDQAEVGRRGSAETAVKGKAKGVEREEEASSLGRPGARRVGGRTRGRAKAATPKTGEEVERTPFTRSVKTAAEPATDTNHERADHTEHEMADPVERPVKEHGRKVETRSRRKRPSHNGDPIDPGVLPDGGMGRVKEETGAEIGAGKPDPAILGEGSEGGLAVSTARGEQAKGGEESQGEDEVEGEGVNEGEQGASSGVFDPSDGLTEYERQRLENIRRNQMLMASLGLQGKAAAVALSLGTPSVTGTGCSSGALKPKGARKRKTAGAEGAGLGDLGVRRSRRLREGVQKGHGVGEEGGKAEGEGQGKGGGAELYEEEGSAEVMGWFNDSSVLRYICGNKRNFAGAGRNSELAGQAAEAGTGASGERCEGASVGDTSSLGNGSREGPGSVAGVQSTRGSDGEKVDTTLNMDGASGSRAGRGADTPGGCTAVPTRLSFAGPPLEDPALTRMYSVHVLSLEDGTDTCDTGAEGAPMGRTSGASCGGLQEAGPGAGIGAQGVPGGKRLVVAAGHNGRISVFGWSGSEVDGEATGPEAEQGQEQDGEGKGRLLLSWKGHGGWISHVQFLADRGTADATLLLSSSNDRTVTLWDINRQQQPAQGSRKGVPAEPQGAPKVVHRSACPWHTQGVFGMHHAQGLVATASKDRSVGVLRVHPWGALELQRHLQGHHEGAVRGVHFRDSTILADCGADSMLCIHDLREPEGSAGDTRPSMVIEGAHTSPINTVQWHPSNPHWVLSASHDPVIRIHDLRRAGGEPLHSLSGHVRPGVQRCRNIYRPTFACGGRLVVSPGEGSESVSVFCLDPEPKLLSRGRIERNANLATVECAGSHGEQGSMIWLGGREVLPLLLE